MLPMNGGFQGREGPVVAAAAAVCVAVVVVEAVTGTEAETDSAGGFVGPGG